VLATDWDAAARLFNRDGMRQSRSVSCLYFAATSLPSDEPMLYLNGEKDGIINNLCFPTTIAPTYAPAHQHLVSVSVLGDANRSSTELEAQVRGELARWFGESVDTASWRHLRTYSIKHALPDQSPGVQNDFRGHRLTERIFICGDYTENASINGALVSGRKAAEALLESLQTSAA
jgi:protoporphyrinogen oxidase